MAKLALNDAIQLYHDTICMYKGQPVRVISIDADFIVTLIYLRQDKRAKVEFEHELFGPPLGRIGFVNEGVHTFYVTRQPIRRYQVGLNRGNIGVRGIPGNNPRAFQRDYDACVRMVTKAWGKALDNDYPTLAEALRIATEHKGSVAFDKQFAVDHNRTVFYKDKVVGSIPPRMSTVKRIVFNVGFEHLDTLLTRPNDKTTRTIAAKAD